MLENSNALGQVIASRIDELNRFCEENYLIGKVVVDHIGLKCSSKEKYEALRSVFEGASRFIYQSIISSRRIAIIGLIETVPTEIGDLKYLELSDQKVDGSQGDGFDHIEIVPTTILYEELIEMLTEKGLQLKEAVRIHHTTHDIKLPSGFIIRLSREMLLEKIKREEVV